MNRRFYRVTYQIQGSDFVWLLGRPMASLGQAEYEAARQSKNDPTSTVMVHVDFAYGRTHNEGMRSPTLVVSYLDGVRRRTMLHPLYGEWAPGRTGLKRSWKVRLVAKAKREAYQCALDGRLRDLMLARQFRYNYGNMHA